VLKLFYSPMPSEQPVPDPSLPEQPLPQDKLCSSCHSPLVDSIVPHIFIHQAICSVCHDPLVFSRLGRRTDDSHGRCSEVESELSRCVGPDAANEVSHISRRIPDDHFHDDDVNTSAASSASSSPLSTPTPPEIPFHRLHVPSPNKHSPLAVNNSSLSPTVSHRSCDTQSVNTPRRHDTSSTLCPDPLSDITRLRVRSQRYHCLYPGASFQGTQKSGRNSYDVNVTIVVRIHWFCSAVT
jgi:hypothetical protein